MMRHGEKGLTKRHVWILEQAMYVYTYMHMYSTTMMRHGEKGLTHRHVWILEQAMYVYIYMHMYSVFYHYNYV